MELAASLNLCGGLSLQAQLSQEACSGDGSFYLFFSLFFSLLIVYHGREREATNMSETTESSPHSIDRDNIIFYKK